MSIRWDFMGPLVPVTKELFLKIRYDSEGQMTPHTLRVRRIKRRFEKRRAYAAREEHRRYRAQCEINAAEWDIRSCGGLIKQIHEELKNGKQHKQHRTTS